MTRSCQPSGSGAHPGKPLRLSAPDLLVLHKEVTPRRAQGCRTSPKRRRPNRSDGNAHLLLGSGRCGSLEPGCCLEPLEDLERLGEACGFALLEQCHREPEGHPDVAKPLGRRREAPMIATV